MSDFSFDKASKSSEINIAYYSDKQTTHYSIVDAACGNNNFK
jgi:gamma-glutamyltranspeptidase